MCQPYFPFCFLNESSRLVKNSDTNHPATSIAFIHKYECGSAFLSFSLLYHFCPMANMVFES